METTHRAVGFAAARTLRPVFAFAAGLLAASGCGQPVEPIADSDAKSLSSNVGDALCVLARDGAVRCGPVDALVLVPEMSAAIQVATTVDLTRPRGSNWKACAVLPDHATVCRITGELDGYSVLPAGMVDVRQLAFHPDGGCALRLDGTVLCWDQALDAIAPSTPAPVASLAGAVQISVGGFDGGAAGDSLHGCALLDGGQVSCWGSNRDGQLGDEALGVVRGAAVVRGVGPATAVAVGNSFSCALLATGGVECWGANDEGQLGDGAADGKARGTPAPVLGVVDARLLAAGPLHACAVLADGTVRCWGYNASGELGVAPSTSRSTPVTAEGIHDVAALSLAGHRSCVVRTDGSALCWGDQGGGASACFLASGC